MQSAEGAKTKQERLVLCITGMPGAGKSTAAEVSKEMGFEVFRMGDDVRMEAERRKVPPTDENLGAIMLQLRQSGGPVAIAKLCEKRIEKDAKSKLILIDGVRNVNEYLAFKALGKAVLIAVHSSPSRRFEFLRARARSDSPANFDSFEARDRRELTVGIGEVIALSDEIIVNEHSLENFKEDCANLFLKLTKSYQQQKSS